MKDAVKKAITENWPGLALFAYQHFTEEGRGVIYARNVSGEVEFFYIPAEQIDPTDDDLKRLLRSYEPDTEVVIQYKEGTSSVRTLHYSTRRGGVPPKQIWTQYMVREIQKDPSKLAGMPDWFQIAYREATEKPTSK